MLRALPALLLGLVAGLSAEARAEDCTHALTVRGGVAYDPDTGAVVPLCDGDLLPTADVLWLIQREGRATEATSALELVRAELAAERDLHRADVERLTAEVQAERDARLAAERERAPAPCPSPPSRLTWAGVGAAIATAALVTLHFALQ